MSPFAKHICLSIRLGGDEILRFLDKHMQSSFALHGAGFVQLELESYDQVTSGALLLVKLLRLEYKKTTRM